MEVHLFHAGDSHAHLSCCDCHLRCDDQAHVHYEDSYFTHSDVHFARTDPLYDSATPSVPEPLEQPLLEEIH
jgi:hypothetical protein